MLPDEISIRGSHNSDDKLPDECFALPIAALAASATYRHSAAPLSVSLRYTTRWEHFH